MDKRQKQKFIRDLIGGVQELVLMKVDQMPDDWDGHELRRYIADKFEDSAMTVGRKGQHGKPYARRYREYKNEVITRNL
jgi:hypothetical protein